MHDITIAIIAIFILGAVGMSLVEPNDIVSVLSYVVTAVAGLATGHTIKKP